MRKTICDICDTTINQSEGRVFLYEELATVVAESISRTDINDMCICCVNALKTGIKEAVENWLQTKGGTE